MDIPIDLGMFTFNPLLISTLILCLKVWVVKEGKQREGVFIKFDEIVGVNISSCKHFYQIIKYTLYRDKFFTHSL